ncbi:MAG: phospholipase D-like domain-containing protein, partial [Syntrophobacteraceae bacterium]|nr:phospholipase D-like domain-containing protein [Desulfobacteraceae bacterium]
WQWAGGELDPTRTYFPQVPGEGDAMVMVVGNTPGQSNRTTYLMYLSAIRNARYSIHLTVAYFAPGRAIVSALANAARRGVDVRMVVPLVTDSPVALHAGEYYYSRLLKAGVKLYRRRGGVLHAKTAVIDGVWSTVGSTNLDLRSFWYNDEVNAIILDRDFALSMEKLFDKDMEESNPLSKEEWKARSTSNRIKEWGAHLVGPLL